MNRTVRVSSSIAVLAGAVLALGAVPRAQAQTPPPFDAATAPSEQKRYAASSPQIVGLSSGGALVIASQRNIGDVPNQALVTLFKPSGSGFVPAWEKKLPLARLVGMASDGANLYAVSAKNEDLRKDTATRSYRPEVLKMTKFDAAGTQVWEQDLNNESYLGDLDKGVANKGIYSPLTAGTGAVSYGNGKVIVTLASNTLPDSGNTRHQRAQYFVVAPGDGKGFKAAEETSWRHSFDQRLLFDGKDFVFMDLADAGWYMPGGGISLRKIQPTNTGATFSGGREGTYIYVRQGETTGSQNFTFISLGDLQNSASGYAALFTAEKSNRTVARDGWKEPVLEPRNLAFVHVKRAFDTMQEGIWNGVAKTGNLVIVNNEPTSITISSNVVDSVGPPVKFTRSDKSTKTATSTGVVWLTDLPAGVSAERPKFVKVADDRYVALWEEWNYTKTATDTQMSHKSTQAMVVNAQGQVQTARREIAARLNPSGADVPFVLNGALAWVIGNAVTGSLTLNTVDASLRLSQTPLVAGAQTATLPLGPTTAPTPTPTTTPTTTATNTVTTGTAPSSPPAVGAFPIKAATTLEPNRRYRSESGNHYMVFQPDGNIVVYNAANQYVWGVQELTRNFGQIKTALVQPDGNFAAYGANQAYVWSALTRDPDPSAFLTLTPNGLLRLVSGRTNAILWASDKNLGTNAPPVTTSTPNTTPPPPATPVAQPVALEIGRQYALRESGIYFRYVMLMSRDRYVTTDCPRASRTETQSLPNTNMLLRVTDALAQNLVPSNAACNLQQVPHGR